ncbi:MAG: HAD-IA family hydrolase [Rhodospirillaceae bacterium]|nr:HAD-IA family hydrolase [Rhodospirillaceae bacterium]MBT4218440.1 HAD-IA family hydrolase [Rhodospirillaceae bacterium]MBT7356202.1 HAD-IA family hydrolase [Rhodospirillaceae bacterium]
MDTASPSDQSNQLKLAVFDCDGTLVDSLHSIVHSMQQACIDHGAPPPASDAVRRIIGLPLETAIAGLFPDFDDAAVWDIREGYRRVFSGLRDKGEVHEPLYTGAIEALDILEQDGWLLGVATGKAHRGLVSTLGTHDLEGRFVTLQTADRAAGKPHPEMLHNAMSETGVDAARVVMIGDTTFDMEMAMNAGTMAIGVAWGYHESNELKESGADIVIDRFGDISDAMTRLMGA